MRADPVELAFRRAALALLPRVSPVLAAVSGGGDSVALLHLLSRLAPRRGLRIVAAHLDHALRRGSTGDRRFVERLCHELDIPCIAERHPVVEQRRRDESVEEAARRVRRDFLLEVAARTGCDRIATGHTLDDQAETVLMRLVRGAGATGLLGMSPDGSPPFVRPLLGLERQALRAWLARQGLEHREDPTNRRPGADRNRVRARILPVIARELNPRAAHHLVAAAGRLREDALLLDQMAADALDGARLAASTYETAAFVRAPHPIAARMVRLALVRAGADPRRISSRHVEAVLALCGSRSAARVDLPGHLHARRQRGGRLAIGS